MYQTMTQIGKSYEVDAKTVGRVLYDLKIRDAEHPEQKGFPYEQAVTHGIAKAYTGRTGDVYYRYDIDRIKEEFEARLKAVAKEEGTTRDETRAKDKGRKTASVEAKLQEMLSTLNGVLETGEINGIYRLKGDIADIYALIEKRP